MRKYLLFLGLITIVVFSSCDPNSWWESYRYNKKNPFDLYATYELLEAREAGFTYNEDTLGSLLRDSSSGGNYVYAGANMYLDQDDVTALLAYAELGNSVFMFTKHIPEDLTYHLFGPDCFYFTTSGYYNDVEYYYQDTVHFLLEQENLLPDSSFHQFFPYDYKPSTHGWAYVDSARICDPDYGVEVLGTLDSGRVNFLRLEWGAGYLYVNTTPELLTNYYLSDSSRYHYARAVFSYLNPGPVVWDEYARNYRPPKQPNNPNNSHNPNGGRNLLSDNHALRYVLDQPMLAFAWYLFVIGGVLYLLFRGKRRQRMIPLIDPPENTSLQHVDTVARLAHQHGNHRKLALREIKMLRHYLLERYQIRWLEKMAPPVDLVVRTGLSQLKVDRAIQQIKKMESADWVEAKELLDFYQAIQPLYHA